MKKRIFFKQWIMLFLIFSLVSGFTVFAEENHDNSSSLRMSFPDVPAGNWAEKHVSKLALLGITEGDTSGNFNPGQFVRQQDVIKMAVSLMGYQLEDLDSNITSSHPSHVVEFLNNHVDSYAVPYVSFAFREGVLDYNAEINNVGTSGTWGRKNATREWVAKAVIHSINKEDEANELANESTEFKDNLDISAWALGYVNAAVELNIVSGFVDGEFKPKGFVTRDQIAAFLSRAEHYLTKRSDRVKTGIITELTNNTVAIVNESGQVNTYALHNGLQFYSYKVPNNPISASDVKPLYKVYLIQQQNTAYYLEVIDDQLQLESTEGILIATDFDDFDNLLITLLVDGKYRNYSLVSNVEVIKKDGSGSGLGALVDNSAIEIKRNTLLEGEDAKVLQIVIQSIPINKSASGTVESVDVEGKQIVLTDEEAGSKGTYSISDQLLILYGDRVLSGLSELTAGDKVVYEIKNNLVASIDLTEPITPFTETEEGIILGYNFETNIIAIKNNDGKLVAKELADDVDVSLKGSSTATLNNLEIDDQVKLLINGQDKVFNVEVMNREIKKLTQVQIFKFDPNTNNLVLTVGEELEAFKLTNDTIIEHASEQWNIENFDVEDIFIEGKKVDITFSNNKYNKYNKLMDVKLSSYYDGEIKEINSAYRTITIGTENKDQTFTLLSTNSVEVFNKTTAALSDLKIGDSVRVSLNTDQDTVNKVLLKQSVLFRTVSTDPSKREVTVRDQEGETSKLVIGGNLPIQHHSKAIPAFGDIKAGESMIATYYGKTIVSIQIPNAVQGKVKEINALTKTLTIENYSNQTKNFVWREQPMIYDDGSNSSIPLSSLDADDRVEVKVDVDGNLFITILEMKERKFWKYDESENIIYFRGLNWSDEAEFTLAPNAYIHSNGSPISIKELKFLDKTIFYVSNGTLFEVEKK